jgi:transposase
MVRYVGLDVHKREVEVCILDRKGKRVLSTRIPCTRESLTAFAQESLNRQDHLALEASTNTWAVVAVLRPYVRQIVVSNPMKTKAIAEAKIKTDKVDAQVLAQLLRCDFLPGVWQPDEKTQKLRRLTTHRASLIVERTRIKNRIRSLLACRLIEPPQKSIWSKKGLAWLQGLDLPEHEALVLRTDLELLQHVEEQLTTMDRQLAQLAYQEDQVRLLMTLPGLDYTVAQGLLAALGDISRFADGDHAAAYLGLVPSTHQSGDRCYHGSITKSGRSHARWLLTQAAQRLDRHPGPLGVFLRRLCRKKNRNVAVVAAARKLVTVAMRMLKHNEPYRYAMPELVQSKLGRVRFRATGVRQMPTKDNGQGRVNHARGPGLAEVYQREGLPPAKTVEELPLGEQRMLRSHRAITFAREIQRGKPKKRTPVKNK